MSEVSLEQLNFERFVPLQKTKFRVLAGPDVTVELELTEATRSRVLVRAEVSEGTAPESFSLIFNGSDQVFLPQHNYRFEHDQLGEFDLFIVPVGRSPGCFHYQAVINRLAV